MNIYKYLYNEIKKYKVIYIVRHIGPDPDAFASQMALKDSILETFEGKKVYAVGTTVAKFKYFGKVDKVDKYDYESSLVITVDVPDKKRVDIDNFDMFKHIIKIDHHPLIDKFSDYEYIDDTASSASELVYNLIENTKLKMTTSIAEKLYMGIVSDSIRFRVSTNYKTFDAASSLLRKYKIDINKLYNQLYKRPISEVRLEGYIASTLKISKNGFAYLELDNDIIKSIGADPTSASNMINDFNNIDGLFIWMFITYDEKNELYRINIRSNGPEINEVALKYGGGGHKYASGVRTKDKNVIPSLIEEYENLAREYKKELNDGNN